MFTHTSTVHSTLTLLGPDFHNGTASGLRVGFCFPTALQEFYRRSAFYHPYASTSNGNTTTADSGSGTAAVSVTRNWILYNRTYAQSGNRQSTHAGMLFALGLQGHLKALTVNDICDYLTQGHEPTTVAILLGVYIRCHVDCVSSYIL